MQGRLDNRDKMTVPLMKAFSWENPLFLEEGQCYFFLLRPLTNWMRVTHIIEGNLLYSKSADLHVNLIQIISLETSRMFDQTPGYTCLGKWTHPINHHTALVHISYSSLRPSSKFSLDTKWTPGMVVLPLSKGDATPPPMAMNPRLPGHPPAHRDFALEALLPFEQGRPCRKKTRCKHEQYCAEMAE